MSFANILLTLPKYRHLRLANLSKKVDVCASCYRAYSTIDQSRQRVRFPVLILTVFREDWEDAGEEAVSLQQGPLLSDRAPSLKFNKEAENEHLSP